MLKPREEIEWPYPPRTFWGHLGDAVGRPWGRSGSTFGSTAWLFAAVFDQIRSFSANFCYFVRRASVLRAILMYVLAILAKIRLKIMVLRTELLKKLKITKVLDMLSLPYYCKGPDCKKSQQTLRKTV